MRSFLSAFLICVCVVGIAYSQPRRDDDNNLYDQNRRRNEQDQMDARQGYEDEARSRNYRDSNYRDRDEREPDEAELKAEGRWIR